MNDGSSLPSTTGPLATGSSSGEATSGSSGLDGTTDGEPLSAEPGESFYAFVGERVLLDGSASWREIKHMKAYRASRLWDADGAYGMW